MKPDTKTKHTLEHLQEQLGITFENKALLERAFIHRSYLNEHPKLGLEHNERLEFLGDAVLELVVTDYLYRKFEIRRVISLTGAQHW